MRHTPGGAFGSARYKLKGLEENRAEYERLIEVFKAHNIGYFFYNGGGDSADTCFKVSQFRTKLGFPVQAIHVPKTVDNDLPITDTCPGFGSVAKYVAVSTLEAALDVAPWRARPPRYSCSRSWAGMRAGLQRQPVWRATAPHDPPHIILFPEMPFDESGPFSGASNSAVRDHEYCVVVVSEGARLRGWTFPADAGTTDAFGHKQLGGVAQVVAQMVRDELGYKYHYAIADYLQRSARHIASRTDVEQAYAVGKAAVELALAGENSVMPTIGAKSDQTVSLDDWHGTARQGSQSRKKCSRNFNKQRRLWHNARCRRYLEPLIAGEDYPPYSNGLPVYVTLRNVPVKRKLDKEFQLK